MLHKNSLIIVLLVYCSLTASSQLNTSSPYSRFGLGEMQKQGFIKSLSMGSTGLALRTNNQINYLNPASYTATDTMSFIFDFGLNTYRNYYISSDDKTSMGNINLHHIAIAFPVTRWWKSSAGITPYTSVGYNIKESQNLQGIGAFNYYFTGNGGLNKLFVGNAVSFFNRINIGFNMSYLFGYINYNRQMGLLSDNAAAIPSSENRMNIGGMMYHLGFQYSETIKEKYFITIGAIIENKSDLKTEGLFRNQLIFPGNSAQINDSVIIFPSINIHTESLTGKINLPRNVGVGLSLGIRNVLTLTGDYYMQDWSNTLILGKNDSLTNSGSMHLGAEFIPSTSMLRSYFSRIHYRVGGYQSNTYISIRGQQINDYGMTFGLGLPFRNTKTSFNVGVILGQRGTLKNDLIKENYGIVHFGVSLHDIWFRKRKYE